MAYEIYAREFRRASTSPTLTISPLGRMSLNRSASELFDKEAVENVLLLWDKAAYRFAIRPITKKDPRSFNVRYSKKKGNGAAFSGVMFLKHIGYDFSQTRSFPIKWNADESVFEVDLPQEQFGKPLQLVQAEGGKKHGKAATGD